MSIDTAQCWSRVDRIADEMLFFINDASTASTASTRTCLQVVQGANLLDFVGKMARGVQRSTDLEMKVQGYTRSVASVPKPKIPTVYARFCAT